MNFDESLSLLHTTELSKGFMTISNWFLNRWIGTSELLGHPDNRMRGNMSTPNRFLLGKWEVTAGTSGSLG